MILFHNHKMDQALRYSLIVQVIFRKDHDTFYGYVPDFGIEAFEVVQPGNVSQEIMFHLKMRRMIGESIIALKNEGKELPPIRQGNLLSYSPTPPHTSELETVSTTIAAEMLGVHPDTVRTLFDCGVLKGFLTQGGQRMISVTSLREEETRMRNRAELRKFEQRNKKKNLIRKEKRIQKKRTLAARRFQENMAELKP